MNRSKKKNKTQIEEIESLAKLQFSPQEIAIIVGIPNVDKFLQDISIKGTKHYIAYNRGRLRAIADVRSAIFKMALNGSTPAQREFVKLFENETSATPSPGKKGSPKKASYFDRRQKELHNFRKVK